MVQTPWANGLTVGDVAGLIAGGISLVHTTTPLLAALVVIAIVSKGEQTAATWSVASRSIQGSLWPWILRGDSAATRHVRWPVVLYSGLVAFSTIILVVAHFFTPLPLVSETELATTLKNASFGYVRDNSFFGQGTPDRPSGSLNRICEASDFHFTACPHSQYVAEPGDSDFYYSQRIVNTTIPDETSNPFLRAATGDTVAGPLDIQFRNTRNRADDYVDGGVVQKLGEFLAFDSFMLENSYHLIEGVIVDSKKGGIGLRNHTIPNDLDLGASWSEDILWIEPVTSCTDTNLTFGFTISINPTDEFGKETFGGTLRDDGGFAKLNAEPPNPSWEIVGGPHATWNISGPLPDLNARSYQAAWWNNFLTKAALNITKPTLGEVYYDGNSFANFTHQNKLPGAIQITGMDGAYLNNTLFGNSSSLRMVDFSYYGQFCSGFLDAEPINATKVYIRCGYLYGVPRPAVESWAFDLGSNWLQPLYTCASAVRASVKTVHFKSTGKSSLDDLQVINVTDKVYPDASLEPLWAVEKVQDYPVHGINLFWGLVDHNHSDRAGLEVRRGKEFYLPVAPQRIYLGFWFDGFAAGTAFTAAWNSVYLGAAYIAGCGVLGIPGYSGENNYALSLKYRGLTNTTQGAEKLLNLIWTDFVAWSVVGTKTGFENQPAQQFSKRSTGRQDQSPTLGFRAVYAHKRVIKYSNMYYAIPAFFAAGLWLFLLLSVLWLCCGFGMSIRWRKLNHYVNQTSMGRVATNGMRLDQYDAVSSTRNWLARAGELLIDVPTWTTNGSSRQALRNKKRTSSFSPAGLQSRPWGAVGGEYELPERRQNFEQQRSPHLSTQPQFPEQQDCSLSPHQRRQSWNDYEQTRHPAPLFDVPESQTTQNGWNTNFSRFGSLHRIARRPLAPGPSLTGYFHQPDAESEEALL